MHLTTGLRGVEIAGFGAFSAVERTESRPASLTSAGVTGVAAGRQGPDQPGQSSQLRLPCHSPNAAQIPDGRLQAALQGTTHVGMTCKKLVSPVQSEAAAGVARSASGLAKGQGLRYGTTAVSCFEGNEIQPLTIRFCPKLPFPAQLPFGSVLE